MHNVVENSLSIGAVPAVCGRGDVERAGDARPARPKSARKSARKPARGSGPDWCLVVS